MPRLTRKIEDEEMITYSVLDRPSTESDFVNNLELLQDMLPQPYRRIDKILNEMLDNIWEIIVQNERERQTELSKPRPEVFTNETVLEDIEDFNCICPSRDENNEFIFLGKSGSLVCVDAAAMCTIDKIDLPNENANLIQISTQKLKEQVHLVVSFTDQGFFLYAFVCCE
jgi:hypothetical protein